LIVAISFLVNLFSSWFQVTGWIIRFCRSRFVPRNCSQSSPCTSSTTPAAQKKLFTIYMYT